MSEFGNFDDLWIFGSLLPLQLLLLFLSFLLPLLLLLLPLFFVFPLLLLPFLPHLDGLDYCLCAAAISGVGKKN